MTTDFKTAHPLASDRSFRPLAEYVIAATGLAYYHTRRNELADRVARRLQCLGIKDCGHYLRLLTSGDAGEREFDFLIEDLTIGETHFFRHLELFQALEETILPEAIERNTAQRRLRIWSAGASIGAEAYTVSILLKHHLAHLTRGWDVTIIGTDINRTFLARAAEARFEEWALRGTSDDIRRQCFSQHGPAWVLKPRFREGVSFRYHNLAEHPFPSMLHNLFAFDVILCRNVMIYFSEPVIRDMISHMRRCLVDGGWLLVGHAEHNQDLFREFRTVGFSGASAYRRMDGHGGPVAVRPVANQALMPLPAASPAPAVTRPSPGRRQSPAVPVHSASEAPAELSQVRALADGGDLRTAVAVCERLLKTHKMNPAYHLYYALLVEQLGQHAACESSLRRAIYVDRGYVLAHYYLGATLQRQDRGEEAARSLRNALHLLALMADDHVIDHSDGLTVAELSKLARMQLETLHPEVLPA